MSAKHPIIAVTGSSGAGTSTSTNAFRSMFHQLGYKAAVVEGDSFHRYTRPEMDVAIRKAREKKPVIASMGDTAASGGYYISMGCKRIFAEPGTLTGSIGVVGGKLVTGGLFDWVGMKTDTISRGANSAIMTADRPWNESERKVIKESMQDIYDLFLDKTLQGRNAAGVKMKRDDLLKLPGGRVWTGRQAKENGLVDELGTLHDAIQSAKQLAGIDPDAKVTIERLPEPTNFFESLFGEMDAEKEVRLGSALAPLAPEMVGVAAKAYRLRTIFQQPAALIMPFELEIR